MDYEVAKFEQLPETPSEKLNKTLKKQDNETMRNNLLKSLGDIEILKSDYLGTSSFYYSRKADIVYELDNYKICLVKPTSEVEKHIRKINNL